MAHTLGHSRARGRGRGLEVGREGFLLSGPRLVAGEGCALPHALSRTPATQPAGSGSWQPLAPGQHCAEASVEAGGAGSAAGGLSPQGMEEH